jgi:hypothetical protein
MSGIVERSMEESPRPESFIKSEEAFENENNNKEDISSCEEELEDEFNEGELGYQINKDKFYEEINEIKNDKHFKEKF